MLNNIIYHPHSININICKKAPNRWLRSCNIQVVQVAKKQLFNEILEILLLKILNTCSNNKLCVLIFLFNCS